MPRPKLDSDNAYPFRFGSTQEQCATGATNREFERKLARRDMFMRRRRWLLWTPLAGVGAALLVWQVTADVPTPVAAYLGIALCLPWVADC